MEIIKKRPALIDIDTVVKKIDESTSSITELRIPIFLPISQLTHNSLTLKNFKKNGDKVRVKTSWGECEIRVKLMTQVHRDLLDCIMTYKTDMRPHGEDEVLVLFSLTKILNMYSNESGTAKKNTEWLKSKMLEIRSVIIKPIEKDKLTADFNIIRSIIDASDKYGSYGIVFDKRYLDFFMQELTINYEKILPDLLQVNNATFRSIIRWFITHKKDQKFYVDTVLTAIGFPTDSAQMVRKIKRELSDQCDIFVKFGIEYDPAEKIFYYRGNESVGFIPSLLKKQNKKVFNGEVLPAERKQKAKNKSSVPIGYDLKKSLTQLLKGKKIDDGNGTVRCIKRVQGTKEEIQIIFEDGNIDQYQNVDNLDLEKFKQLIYKGVLSEEVV